MKLTKLQRHTAYIIMLQELEEIFEDNAFYCVVIFQIGFGWGGILEDLPELMSRKPVTNDKSGGWFPVGEFGKQKRIDILKQCIEETY